MKTRRANTLKILTAVLIWAFLFALPFLLWAGGKDIDLARLFYGHALSLAFAIFIFYFNYYVLTERFLFRKRPWLFALSAIATVLISALLSLILKDWLMHTFAIQRTDWLAEHPFWFYMREVSSLATITVISITAKSIMKWNDTENRRLEEERRRKEAELQNLKQQINPHFFFNTLNNIYALIELSPAKAQDTVLELSKLMRYVLYENDKYFVPVSKELDFIRNYIELMRIRLTDNIDVQVNFDIQENAGRQIAPMIFISLIENAFKHGVSHTHPSFVHLDFRQVEDRIVCTICNSYFPKDNSDKSGSGIGLENLHRRLDILYPHKHILRTEVKGDTYVSELIVPLK